MAELINGKRRFQVIEQVPASSDPVARHAARRTAWIVGAVAFVIYVGAILSVVMK